MNYPLHYLIRCFWCTALLHRATAIYNSDNNIDGGDDNDYDDNDDDGGGDDR